MPWIRYPFHSIHDALHRVFDAFGPRRMFWGTDITRMHCTWRQGMTLFTEELPWLKGTDLELVMGQAFCDWIGWESPRSRHNTVMSLDSGSNSGHTWAVVVLRVVLRRRFAAGS